MPSDEPTTEPARRGRRRDPTRDGDILNAALDILREVGYDGMTMDAVAARARAGKATVYRRWQSKGDLILDAVASMGDRPTDLPDTGTLRGDLVALLTPESVEDQARKLGVMAGLSSTMLNDRALADAVMAAVVGPWIDANRLLMRRAVERGEIPAATDVEALCHVVPSMATLRSLTTQAPPDQAYVVTLIDVVLLPAIFGVQAVP